MEVKPERKFLKRFRDERHIVTVTEVICQCFNGECKYVEIEIAKLK